ncbi:MAG: hypothetical protein J6X79_01575 [Bacteroidales bacterium]|nr:hypothetical protein [Bacteroidales bacterium]
MKYKLEIEDDLFDFEGWAFLHFHTSMPGYAFADCLNRLYDYRLARVDDMTSLEGQWPVYRYEDAVSHQIFFLVERPAAAVDAPWEAGDKLLVVKCENAETVAHHIFADFTSNAAVDEADLLAREHAALLEDLLAEFTVVNILDFSAPVASRKAAKERQLVQQHCDGILAYIEQQHLDLSDEERMRLERLS